MALCGPPCFNPVRRYAGSVRRPTAILARVLLALAIGAVVSAGVAAGCAMRICQTRSSRPTPGYWIEPATGRQYTLERELSVWGSRYVVVFAWSPGIHVRRDKPQLAGGLPAPAEALPRTAPSGGGFVRIAGWPCECVWGASVPGSPNNALIGAISVGRPYSVSDFRGIWGALPVTPIWSGLAIDTLFYGVIAWGLLLAPGAIRRCRRRRGGRCVKCGYDRAGLAAGAACPECGAV